MSLNIVDLKKIRFFDNYTKDQLSTIARMSSIREFKVKEVIFEQYDELSEVYVLLEGTLSLGISLASEKESIWALLKKDNFFHGQQSLLHTFQLPG